MFSHFRPLAWRYNRPWGRNRSMSTTTWLKKKIKIWKFACKQILVREMSLWWLMLQINYCYPIVTWEKSLGLKPVSRDNFRREYLNLKISISSILTPNITSQCPFGALRLCCRIYVMNPYIMLWLPKLIKILTPWNVCKHTFYLRVISFTVQKCILI